MIDGIKSFFETSSDCASKLGFFFWGGRREREKKKKKKETKSGEVIPG